MPHSDLPPALAQLRGKLIVSVQAPTGHPLRGVNTIRALAQAALLGGAAALRINSPENVAAIRPHTRVPIIALDKTEGGPRPFITTSVAQAQALADAGADLIAAEFSAQAATDRPEFIAELKSRTGLPVMADVSTLDEGLRAWQAGADLVGTTLSGYTPQSPQSPEPDLDLVSALHQAGVRTVAEGRISTPQLAAQALQRGAFAVVVGGAITDPAQITRRFADAAAQVTSQREETR